MEKKIRQKKNRTLLIWVHKNWKPTKPRSSTEIQNDIQVQFGRVLRFLSPAQLNVNLFDLHLFSFSATKQKRNKWELKSPGRFSQEARFQHWFWMEEQFSQPKCGSELGSDALPWERNAKSRAFLFCFWAWSVMKWRVGFKVGLLFVTWWIYKIGHWDIIMGLKLGRAGLD